MNEYKIIPEGQKKYILTFNEVVAGELTYTNWSKSKATIQLADGSSFDIAPKGFWERSTEVLRNGLPILSYRMSWRHGMIITTYADAMGQTYRLKTKGFWKGSYVLRDESDQELLEIVPVFKWKGFRTEFTITPSIVFDRLPGKELLMMVSVCIVNYQRRMAAAAAAT